MFFLNLFSVFNRIEDFLLSGKTELILPCRSERINLSSSLRMEKIVGDRDISLNFSAFISGVTSGILFITVHENMNNIVIRRGDL